MVHWSKRLVASDYTMQSDDDTMQLKENSDKRSKTEMGGEGGGINLVYFIVGHQWTKSIKVHNCLFNEDNIGVYIIIFIIYIIV